MTGSTTQELMASMLSQILNGSICWRRKVDGSVSIYSPRLSEVFTVWPTETVTERRAGDREPMFGWRPEKATSVVRRVHVHRDKLKNPTCRLH